MIKFPEKVYYVRFHLGVRSMVRLSKVTRIRQKSHKRPKIGGPKTGPLKQNLPRGFKEHTNALQGDMAKAAFIPKIQ